MSTGPEHYRAAEADVDQARRWAHYQAESEPLTLATCAVAEALLAVAAAVAAQPSMANSIQTGFVSRMVAEWESLILPHRPAPTTGGDDDE